MGLAAMAVAGMVYWVTRQVANDLGLFDLAGWIAFGCAVIAWLAVGLYLRRHHFRGAPTHVKDMDP